MMPIYRARLDRIPNNAISYSQCRASSWFVAIIFLSAIMTKSGDELDDIFFFFVITIYSNHGELQLVSMRFKKYRKLVRDRRIDNVSKMHAIGEPWSGNKNICWMLTLGIGPRTAVE